MPLSGPIYLTSQNVAPRWAPVTYRHPELVLRKGKK